MYTLKARAAVLRVSGNSIVTRLCGFEWEKVKMAGRLALYKVGVHINIKREKRYRMLISELDKTTRSLCIHSNISLTRT